MFEDLIIERVNSELEKISTTGEISYSAIPASDLSTFTKNFISVETDRIKDREHFRELVEKSVKLGINYTIRPNWTLENYLFGSYDAKPVEDILEKIEIFQFYHYYVDLVYNYINEKSLVVITKINTKRVLEDADKMLYEKLTKDISSVKIKNFFLQIFKLKYYDENQINLDSTIPFLLIRLFLEDKKFQPLLKKFAVIDNISDSLQINLKDIVKVLTDKYEADKEKTEVTAEPVKEEIHPDKKATDELPEVPESSVSLSGKHKEKETASEEKEYDEDRAYPVEVIDHPIGFTSKHLSKLFKQSELAGILKKVFRNEQDAMESALDDLYEISKWQVAVQYLKDVYIKNNVDLQNKYVILFIDVMQNYFTNKEDEY